MLNESEVFLNAHIEKCGGTTVQNFLANRVFHPSEVMLYTRVTDSFISVEEDPTNSPDGLKDNIRLLLRTIAPYFPSLFMWSKKWSHSKKRDANNYSPENIPDHTKAITGHFVADQFERPSLRLPKKVGMRAVMIREPLSRTMSHFDHWRDSQGKFPSRIPIPFDQKMSMRDFCLLSEIADFQSGALGQLSLDDFDVVGITDNVTAFERQLSKAILGHSLEVPVHKYNAAPLRSCSEREKLLGDTRFVRQYGLLNSGDVALYDAAVSRVTQE